MFHHKILVCILIIVSCVNSVISAPTCAEDYYWDTGVDDCEHCRDICQHALLQKTTEACQQNCPAYAKKLHDGVQNSLGPSSVDNGVADPSSEPSQDKLSLGAKVGIGVASFVVIGIAITVFVCWWRIKQNRKKPCPPATRPGVTPKLVGVQETHSGRQGQQEIALLGSSKGTVDEDEDENTLTKSVGPIYIPAGHQTGVLATPSLVSTRI